MKKKILTQKSNHEEEKKVTKTKKWKRKKEKINKEKIKKIPKKKTNSTLVLPSGHFDLNQYYTLPPP